MRYLLLTLLFLAAPLVAQDDKDEPNVGYRIVHPDGTVEYTDDPTAGGQEFELRQAPTTTMKQYAPPPQRPISKYQHPPPSKFTGYTAFGITTPQPEQTIWYTGEKISVAVSLDPQLQPGHKVLITMDGKEVASGAAMSFPLGQIDRGSHSLSADVLDRDGTVLISTGPVTFFLRQRSSIKH